MKKACVMAGLVLAAGCTASAQTVYNDAAGDTFTTAGGGILDILSLEVNNTLTDIVFTLTLGGDVVATDWGKYMVMIDRADGGDPDGNGWGRPIGWSNSGGFGPNRGADVWLGSWVDSGNGLENRQWNPNATPAAWELVGATYNNTPGLTITKSGNTVTLSARLADLGISVGQDIFFDVFSSGGGNGDGAIDSLGNPFQQVSDWGEYSRAEPLRYRVIPAPAAAALLGVAGLAAFRRRR